MDDNYCLFCDYSNSDKHSIIAENDLFYARWDNFPVSRGHAEVIPKKHTLSFFDLTDTEVAAMFNLAKEAKGTIDDKYHPDAYNIGVNDGEAAGRTVHHLHLHLIPRYKGDVPEPKGGITHVIPHEVKY